MKNLNEEEFWAPMRGAYPDAVRKFEMWLPDYKRVVKWTAVFGDKVDFDDLPYELQLGIMNRFFIEISTSRTKYDEQARIDEWVMQMGNAMSVINLAHAKQN